MCRFQCLLLGASASSLRRKESDVGDEHSKKGSIDALTSYTDPSITQSFHGFDEYKGGDDDDEEAGRFRIPALDNMFE